LPVRRSLRTAITTITTTTITPPRNGVSLGWKVPGV